MLAHLDALGVPYVINPRMVRGLDYYTKTTFEFVHDGLGAQSGIGGGGRYDGLMRQLGGKDLSGIGFGLGVDRTLLALKAEGKTVGDDRARRRVRRAAGRAGQAASWRCWPRGCGRPGCGSTWPTATAGSRARCAPPTAPAPSIALVAGDRDIEAGTVGVKELATGEQVDVAADAVLAEVLSRLRPRLTRACASVGATPSKASLRRCSSSAHARAGMPRPHAVTKRQRMQ